jgi:anti-sigma factor RsiW
MSTCRDIEQTLTAYVDGECAGVERSSVEAHLEDCPRCRARMMRERAAHDLLRSKCRDLRGSAPPALRQRCAAQQAAAAERSRFAGPRRWLQLSVAATLVLAAGVFLLFGLGSSVETYAAQLAADHIKCFQFPPDAVSMDVDSLGRDWHAANGWPLRLAPSSVPEQLQLLGIRRCGSTKGRVAHVLYRWRGERLSVFVLNGQVEDAADGSRGDDAHNAVSKLGEQEIIWSAGGRTYAVVARAPIEELRQVARYIRSRTE